MRPPTLLQIIAFSVIAAGMLLFTISTFSRRWFFDPWVKSAFRMSAAAALPALIIVIVLARSAFRWPVFWALQNLKMTLLGLSLGPVLLFFISGEARRGIQRWREHKRQAQLGEAAALNTSNQAMQRTAGRPDSSLP